uniref:Unannotated protein n=1 Tax=freshwater metagenome TaxID=449393 RepID=A0A6J5ZMD1_9ZZZZ
MAARVGRLASQRCPLASGHPLAELNACSSHRQAVKVSQPSLDGDGCAKPGSQSATGIAARIPQPGGQRRLEPQRKRHETCAAVGELGDQPLVASAVADAHPQLVFAGRKPVVRSQGRDLTLAGSGSDRLPRALPQSAQLHRSRGDAALLDGGADAARIRRKRMDQGAGRLVQINPVADAALAADVPCAIDGPGADAVNAVLGELNAR